MTSNISDHAAARLLRSAPRTERTIDLSVGEPQFATPADIARAGTAAIEAGRTHYTPRLGLASLREVVCDRLEREKGYRPAFDDTIITGGGSPATAIAIAAACAAGDTILVPDPSWPNYEMFARRIGVGCRRYGLQASGAIDLEEIDRLVDRSTKLIVINNPSNPTGALTGAEDIAALVELARRRGLWILSDEAYESIVFDGETAVSPSAVGGMDLTFAAYTLSKTYAMTGWRVGYLVVPEPFRKRALELQATISGCAPGPAQYAAEAALLHGGPAAEAMRAEYETRRDTALRRLDGTGLLEAAPRGAFYLWLSVAGTGLTGEQVTDLLVEQADVLVSAGEVYTERSDQRLRVSIAADADAVDEGLGRIVDLITTLREEAAR